MRKIYCIFLLLILIIYSREDDPIQVKITAMSGIINKEIITISNQKKLSFNIECVVDKNITTKISKIDITIKIKILGGDTSTFDSTCNIVSALIDSDKSDVYTKLKCKMNYSTYNNDDIVDKNLIVDSSGTPTYTSDIATFTFEDFPKIGTPIVIQGLNIYNLEKDFCENKIFKFEMKFTTTNDNFPPLESTICDINLSNNEVHNVAKCAIPYSSNVVLCYIDVSEKKITKGEKIEIKAQENSKCQNGQVVNIGDAQNILEMEVDCDKMHFLVYNMINILFLILILL